MARFVGPVAEVVPDGSDLIPEPIPGLTSEDRIGGGIIIRKSGTARGAKEVRLEPIGAAAWRLMDGKRRLRDIRAAMQEHPEYAKLDKLSVRLGQLVSTLVSKGFLALKK